MKTSGRRGTDTDEFEKEYQSWENASKLTMGRFFPANLQDFFQVVGNTELTIWPMTSL